VPDERERFLALNDRVFALYGDGHLADALAAVEQEEASLPGWRSRTTYWRACLVAQLGGPEEALSVLRTGLDEGLWWRPDWLTTDEDLERLWDLPAFAEVVAESERRQQEANAGQPDRPRMLLFPPRGRPRGVLVALHMYGEPAEEAAPRWSSATDHGLAVCVPESTRVQAEGRPCWDDDMAATRDVTLAIEEAVAAHPEPREGALVLAGASQGGMRAIELALLGEPVPARAFIGVVAGLADPDLVEGRAWEAAEHGLRGWLITGDRDAARQAVEVLHAQLSQAGLDCRLDHVPGLGHRFPDDFEERLGAMLPRLLG
jgi:predicted esterase